MNELGERYGGVLFSSRQGIVSQREAWMSKKIASKVEDRHIVPKLQRAVKKLHKLTLPLKDTVDNPMD